MASSELDLQNLAIGFWLEADAILPQYPADPKPTPKYLSADVPSLRVMIGCRERSVESRG